jgi:hypothetical protein
MNRDRGSSMIEFMITIFITGTIATYIFILLNEAIERTHINVTLFKALRKSALESNAAKSKEIDEQKLQNDIRSNLALKNINIKIKVLANTPNLIKIMAAYDKKELVPIIYKKTLEFKR